MQAHLAQFLDNNDPLPEEICEEIKGLLSEPLKELEKKEVEYRRLRESLDCLEDERKVIRNLVDDYGTILSPLRRIPSDILDKIFHHSLPTHRNPAMSITEAPLLLTRICRSWRFVALSSPHLWAKLHIPLLPLPGPMYGQYPAPFGTDEWMVPEDYPEKTAKYFKTMRSRCKLADSWLSRSGMSLLSISLTDIASVNRNPEDDQEEENSLLQLFNIILKFSQRLADLQLSMPFEVYRLLQKRITPDMVPNLRSLRLSLSREFRPYPNVSRMSIRLLHAPNLQSLSVFADRDDITEFDAGTIPSTWNKFTNLSFHSSIPSSYAVQILRQCQNLEHCKLAISDGRDVYISPENALSLLHLRSLSIQVGVLDSMSMLYRRIDAPNLIWFDYQKGSRDLPYDSSPNLNPGASQSSSVLSLLEKSRKMRKFSFDSGIMSAQDILFSFRFLSHLTHLAIGQRHSLFRNPVPSWLPPGHFSLDLLIIKSRDTGALEQEILLPNLEVFAVYQMASFTDESLLQFILGRLPLPGGSTQNGPRVSSLRRVTVNFERTRNLDIEEQVHARANAAGVEIELDLTYFTEPPPLLDSKYGDFFSPWHGLSDDDRSWTYPEIGNEDFL